MRGRAGLAAGLTALGLVVGLGAVPAHGTDRTDGPPPEDAASTGSTTDGPAADADVLARAATAAARVVADPAAVEGTASVVRSAARLVGQRWYDACHEMPGAAVDVRETAVARVEGASGAELLFQARGCGPVTAETVGPGGSVVWAVASPVSHAPRRVFLVVLHAPTGQLAAGLLRDDDGLDDTPPVLVRGLDVGVVPTDDTVAAVYVPPAALGQTDEQFDVLLRSSPGVSDAAGTAAVDAVPEPDERTARGSGVLSYPYSCDVSSSRVVLATEPGAAGRVAADLRADGVDATASAHVPAVVVDLAAGRRIRSLGVLTDRPEVREVRPLLPVQRAASVPTDPLVPYQVWLPAIGGQAGWDVRADSGDLVLAVVDDGVDGTRTDLAGRVLEGRDLVRGTVLPAGADSDRGAHGTAVAGIAAAAADGRGMVGVARSGGLLRPYRVFDAGGCGDDLLVAEAVAAAVDAGASVVNLSLGAPVRSATLEEAVRSATERGVLVVAASGNGGSATDGLDGVAWPGAAPGAVSVGAVDADGRRAPFSEGGPDLDLVAPGTDVLTLGDVAGFSYVSGTSFSTPMVAGAALLYRAQHPDASPEVVARALRLSARDLGPPGPDVETGHGLLRLPELLAWTPPVALEPTVACPPSVVPPAGFDDVPRPSVHGDAIDCTAWWQVTRGRSAAAYGPEGPVRRDQMAAFLVRALERVGVPVPADPPDAFADDDRSLHEGAIDRLAALGVVQGRPGEGYAPAETVTRGQMAAFLVRAAERARVAVPTSDVPAFEDLARSVHAASITAAGRTGIAAGGVDGRFRPDEPVRRDQIASFLARTLDLLAQSRDVGPPGVDGSGS